MRRGHLIKGNVAKSIYGIRSISGDNQVKNQDSALQSQSRVGIDAIAKRKKLCGVRRPRTYEDDGSDATCRIGVTHNQSESRNLLQQQLHKESKLTIPHRQQSSDIFQPIDTQLQCQCDVHISSCAGAAVSKLKRRRKHLHARGMRQRRWDQKVFLNQPRSSCCLVSSTIHERVAGMKKREARLR